MEVLRLYTTTPLIKWPRRRSPRAGRARAIVPQAAVAAGLQCGLYGTNVRLRVPGLATVLHATSTAEKENPSHFEVSAREAISSLYIQCVESSAKSPSTDSTYSMGVRSVHAEDPEVAPHPAERG